MGEPVDLLLDAGQQLQPAAAARRRRQARGRGLDRRSAACADRVTRTAGARCGAGRSPPACAAARAPRRAAPRQRQRDDAGERLQEPLAVEAELRHRRASATTKPNAVSMVGSGTRPACPARAAQELSAEPLAPSRAARARAPPPGPHRRPGRPAGRAPATVTRQTPRSPSESASCTSALRRVTAASAFWISSTVSACRSVASAARRSASARASAQPGDHHRGADARSRGRSRTRRCWRSTRSRGEW